MNDKTLENIQENTRDTARDTGRLLGALERGVASNEQILKGQHERQLSNQKLEVELGQTFKGMQESLKELSKVSGAVLWVKVGVCAVGFIGFLGSVATIFIGYAQFLKP